MPTLSRQKLETKSVLAKPSEAKSRAEERAIPQGRAGERGPGEPVCEFWTLAAADAAQLGSPRSIQGTRLAQARRCRPWSLAQRSTRARRVRCAASQHSPGTLPAAGGGTRGWGGRDPLTTLAELGLHPGICTATPCPAPMGAAGTTGPFPNPAQQREHSGWDGLSAELSTHSGTHGCRGNRGTPSP